MKRTLKAAAAVAGMLVASAGALADDAAELVALLPDDANMVAVIRVDEILQTPRAQAEGWAEKARDDFLSGALWVPPWVDVLVVGALVHPSVPEEVWTAALVRMPEEISIEQISWYEGAAVETLAGRPTVRGHRDSYFIELQPGVLGVWRPALRQRAAGWARSVAEGAAGPLPDYLQQAAAQQGHVVLAMDLRDTFDPARIFHYLQAQEQFRDTPAVPEELAKLTQTLQGITFTAVVGETTAAQVAIDFGAEVGTAGEHVRTFFVQLLADMGASLEELESASVSTEGASVLLSTELSDESLRRIFSLIVSPAPAAAEQPPPDEQAEQRVAPRVNADASRRYLESVNRVIEDLRRANRRARNYARTAAWHENFARKIEDLPITGVDAALVEYALSITSKLRALAASLRGQAVEVNAQQRTLTYDVHYQPGFAGFNIWGGVGYREPSYRWRSNLQEVRERQAAAVTAGARERQQIWQMIDQERADITQRMRAKYGESFR